MRLPSEADARAIILQRFERGEPAGLPAAEIRALFPVVEGASEPCDWIVRYDDGDSCRLKLSPMYVSPEIAASLEIENPCDDLRFWEAIHSILASGAVVLHLPGRAAPLIAGEGALVHLPPDLIAERGNPQMATTGAGILQAFKDAVEKADFGQERGPGTVPWEAMPRGLKRFFTFPYTLVSAPLTVSIAIMTTWMCMGDALGTHLDAPAFGLMAYFWLAVIFMVIVSPLIIPGIVLSRFILGFLMHPPHPWVEIVAAVVTGVILAYVHLLHFDAYYLFLSCFLLYGTALVLASWASRLWPSGTRPPPQAPPPGRD